MEVFMKRIILRHLSGSKANQVEEFSLDQFKELSIGRDPSSSVRYDPQRDDLVSRQHAKIAPDASDPTQFTITDLNSRNGTYVNKQRITGSVRISPGDVIQFGPSGPEFEFDLDPRPEIVRATREAVLGGVVPSTRESERTDPLPTLSPTEPRPSVGKATVERMITQTKKESRKYLIGGGAAVLVVIVACVALLMRQSNVAQTQLQTEIGKVQTKATEQISKVQAEAKEQISKAKKEAVEEIQKNAPMTATQVTEKFSDAVVQIELGWHLIYVSTGEQLYHRYVGIPYRRRTVYVPAYIKAEDTIEPYLTTEQGKTDVLVMGPQGDIYKGRQNQPIGTSGSGSGFVVGSEGFILTNAHVAASWEVLYQGDLRPGVLVREVSGGLVPLSNNIVQPPRDWVPAKTRTFGGKPIQGKVIDGKHDFLDVIFPKTKDRIPARRVRTSDRHDVALIKVEVPQSLHKVELYDNYDKIKPGDTVTVLGYPAISPSRVAVTRSQNPFSPGGEAKAIADPTLSAGNIGKVIRGQETPGKDVVLSPFLRDSYQLTVNSTGAGNSGGPVFDDHGRVIGIFYAGMRDVQGTRVTFAVPIRYGIEIMGTTPMPQ
jgi:pSer/pThr/pTyr-binding forkhead associated (FHA) protein